LKRCRELAAEAEAFAATMDTPELQDSYLKIARHWREMAAKFEKAAPKISK
jgi:hypothetical protein